LKLITPSRNSDAYHSCYVLSGLSSAQHQWRLVPSEDEDTDGWNVSLYLDDVQIFEEEDQVVPIHPVYAIPYQSVADIRRYFSVKQGF
jgi:protein farnesyltransferase subunit beta